MKDLKKALPILAVAISLVIGGLLVTNTEAATSRVIKVPRPIPSPISGPISSPRRTPPGIIPGPTPISAPIM
jgi:hypothetical protein